MQVKKTYEETVQSKVQEIDQRMQSLTDEIDKAGAEATQQYEREMADLRRRRQDLNERFISLKNAGDDAWEDMKAGLESAVDEMGRALQRATGRFEKAPS